MRNSYYILLSIILLLSCKTQFAITEKVSITHVSEAYDDDEAIEGLIRPYREQADEKMNLVIGFLDKNLEKAMPESSLGNWLADMMLDEINARLDLPIDIAIQNHGGIRLNVFSAGDITVGKVFEVMPFDNLVTIMTLDSTGLVSLLDQIAASGGWPISRTVRMEIKAQKSSNVFVHGEPISDRKYRVALPDYIANGGNNITFDSNQSRQDLGLLIRDLYIEHITKATADGKIQSAVVDGRIKKI